MTITLESFNLVQYYLLNQRSEFTFLASFNLVQYYLLIQRSKFTLATFNLVKYYFLIRGQNLNDYISKFSQILPS